VNGVDARKKLDYSNISVGETPSGGGEIELPKKDSQSSPPPAQTEHNKAELHKSADAVENGAKTEDGETNTKDLDKPMESSLPPSSEASTKATTNDAVSKDEAKKENGVEEGNAEGRTGKYHMDYFGIAGAAYCLLFGKYIEVGTVKNRWVVKGSFKRWWQVKTWEKFFDDMLNPKDEGKDCLPSLLQWREKFMALFENEELREGLDKARQIIEVKLLEKWRRNL
jgi:hypothetical protein